MQEILNAKINYLKWDNERGLTHYIGVIGDGWGCALGGYHLSGECAYMWIMQLMKVLEVSELIDERVVGTVVRVKLEDRKIVAIGHAFKDIWLEPKELFKNL